MTHHMTAPFASDDKARRMALPLRTVARLLKMHTATRKRLQHPAHQREARALREVYNARIAAGERL